MCDLFGTKKAARKAASAAAAADAETKAREEKHQADILAGQGEIDKAFAGYNPAYYGNYKDAYVKNYNPQIDRQHFDAVGKITASLAGRGMLDSTVGAKKFAQAGEVANDARLRVANDAEGAAGDIKTKVAQRKTDLYALNNAAADPQGAAANAVGAATALAAPPAYSQMGQMFSDVLAPLSAYQQAKLNSAGGGYTYRPASSGRVVN